MSPYLVCQAFRFFNLLEDVSLVEFVLALLGYEISYSLFPFRPLAAIEISSSDSPTKSILNALPLVVKDGTTFKRFANASYSSIATLQYSNK